MFDKEIDVAKIMQEIKGNVSEKYKKTEQKHSDEVFNLNPEFGQVYEDVCFTLEQLNNHQDIGGNYPLYEWRPAVIRTPLRLVNKVISKLSRFITGEQNQVNQLTKQAVIQLQNSQRILMRQIEELNSHNEHLERKITELQYANKVIGARNKAIASVESDEKVRQDEFVNDVYLRFEDKFRGTKVEIEKRLQYYIDKYVVGKIEQSNNDIIVDLGCGRGEWLKLLEHNHYSPIGIDMNAAMINSCTQQGLVAYQMDALTYLNSLKDNSVLMITAFQMVEHISTDMLINLLKEVNRVLKPGGIVILETPNPGNLRVGACNFYLDPTHTRPVHPEFLRFVAEECNLVDVEIAYWNDEESEKWWMDVVNADTMRICESVTFRTVADEVRHVFFNSPDYALVARK